eukprot:gene33394-41209_t
MIRDLTCDIFDIALISTIRSLRGELSYEEWRIYHSLEEENVVMRVELKRKLLRYANSQLHMMAHTEDECGDGDADVGSGDSDTSTVSDQEAVTAEEHNQILPVLHTPSSSGEGQWPSDAQASDNGDMSVDESVDILVNLSQDSLNTTTESVVTSPSVTASLPQNTPVVRGSKRKLSFSSVLQYSECVASVFEISDCEGGDHVESVVDGDE